MEDGVLPLKPVKDRLRKVRHRFALFTDRGEEERKNLELMLETYKTSTLPSFLLLDGTGKVRAAQYGSCTEAAFVEFLEQGGLK
jgi:hypothetical protein